MPDFIPHQTDMIRSWGFYQAWQGDSDFVLTLDDDVRPSGDVFEAYEREFQRKRPISPYLSTGALTSSGLEMRGFPYRERYNGSVIVQYGGWNGVLDYDAATQLSQPQGSHGFAKVSVPVPLGTPTTTCIMNCAFRRTFTPVMWQLPMLEGRYNRFGDIWSGLFQKKVLDYSRGVMLINGKANIQHERASDPFKNLEREQPGLRLNEELWGNLEEGDYKVVTDSAYRFFKAHDPTYARYFRQCRDQWLDLFE